MKICRCTPAVAAIPVVALSIALPCRAESPGEMRPLWEVGAGLAVLGVPDYRGSDVRKSYALPIPYVVYRGPLLKADRNGARVSMFESDRLNINLSVNATLPVSSKNNPARTGMPSLKPIVEVGPTVDFTLWRSADQSMKLDARAPLRAAMTVESSPRHIGSLTMPELDLEVRNPAGIAGWRLGVRTGPIYSNRSYNRYFYAVDPQQAIVGRPAYAPAAGYAGTQLTITLSKRFPRFWVGAFLRNDNVRGAVFADSPLVRQSNGVSAGLAVSAILGTSSTTVRAAE